MEKRFYINGEWQAGTAHQDLFAPYDQHILAAIPRATPNDIESAIDAAFQARQSMAALTAYERADILNHLSRLLHERRKEASKLIVAEAGKPIRYALGEIDRAVETYRFAAEEAKRLTGEMIPMDAARNGAGRIGYTIEEPLGVVAAITPFNFPQNLVAHKVAPAIAAGNTVVFKPAMQTPLSAIFLAELLHQTALPKGAFNVITGSGKEIGDAFLASDKVRLITFTGSPPVGKSIRDRAGMKRVILELGSNSGIIVDNNVEIDSIIPKCVTAAFAYQGQVCISLQRIYVIGDHFDAFVEKFAAQTRKLKSGNPADDTTDIAPMIHKDEQQRALTWVREATTAGAKLVCGGEIHNNIFQPTVLTGVPADAKVSCCEVFAPVVIINRVESVEEGIAAINDSDYGLQAGIFTRDIATAFTAAKRLQVGGVLINDVPTFRVDQMPYGGVKDSGTGREGLKYAIREMTETKLVVWNPDGL